jgi:Zn-dependent peptidase ImmA (M78 family)
MTKPDDSLLTPHQLQTVRKHADRLLREAGALKVFPTPIEDIMAAAKLTVVDDELLDAGMLQKFLAIAKSGLATVKSAFSKVMALFESNDRLVVIDRNVPKPKKPFVKLHEAGHGYMPHQSKAYALLHDCDRTLDPDVTDQFEREANVFASETLFQGDVFTSIAADSSFGVKVPIDLAKKFGASNYSAFRRFVATNDKACCVVVLEQLQFGDDGFYAEVRRVVASVSFDRIVDPLPLARTVNAFHPLACAVPHGKQRIVGEREVTIVDRNGEERLVMVSAFNSGHQIFLLMREAGLKKKTLLIVPNKVLHSPAV